jgi:hypothetical protein
LGWRAVNSRFTMAAAGSRPRDFVGGTPRDFIGGTPRDFIGGT